MKIVLSLLEIVAKDRKFIVNKKIFFKKKKNIQIKIDPLWKYGIACVKIFFYENYEFRCRKEIL